MKLFSHLLPYLLLVSFYAGRMNNFSPAQIKAVNRSPYDGAAIRLAGPYDTGHYSRKEFFVFAGPVRDKSRKQIWPWIFFNRFLGSRAGDKTHSRLSDKPAFMRIKGMDIYNREGALGDFFTLYGQSLSIARELGSPGIVIDPEFYNDYGVSGVKALAGRMGQPEEEVKKGLEAIGARLCDAADRAYPRATLWFLETGLGQGLDGGLTGLGRRLFSSGKGPDYRAFTYIVLGLLERARSVHSRITVVSGGAISLTYCQKSLEGLRRSIRRREGVYRGLLRRYPNLALGGAIAPWVSAGEKKGWMKESGCGASEIRDFAGFRPLVKELLASYSYVWVYGAWAGGYDPFKAGAPQWKPPLK